MHSYLNQSIFKVYFSTNTNQRKRQKHSTIPVKNWLSCFQMKWRWSNFIVVRLWAMKRAKNSTILIQKGLSYFQMKHRRSNFMVVTLREIYFFYSMSDSHITNLIWASSIGFTYFFKYNKIISTKHNHIN